MRKIGGRSRLLSIGSVGLAGAAGVAGAIFLASPAGAHTADLQASSTCDKVSGTYSITYTGHSHDTDLNGTATVEGFTPDGAALSPSSQQIDATDSFQFTQTGIPGTATDASVTVRVVWTDGYTVTPQTHVALGGNCAADTPVTAAAPTFADSTCDVASKASYTIPSTEGVDYQVGGKPAPAGTYDAVDAKSITITAVAQPGHQLNGQTSWSHDFPAAPTDCAGPTAPTFTNDVCANHAAAGANYTIPDTEGVEYRVDGETVSAGSHPATDATKIMITAVASDGHPLNGETTWTHEFPAAPTDCSPQGRATAPTFTDATCGSSSASYTVPTSKEIEYRVNGAAVSAGKHSVAAGSTVTVTAAAEQGYTLVGPSRWQHTFPASAAACVAAAVDAPESGPPAAASAPAAPAALANTGLAFPAGQTTIIGLLVALAGVLCIWAGRRPVAAGRHAQPRR